MANKIRYECIDAGSDYCPCYLAETNNCITCSHLQGHSLCDCDWRGVCIFQEYKWNNYRAKRSRKSFVAKIEDKKSVGNNLIIFKINVGRTMARQLKQPGSYIFVRPIDKPQYFDIPISIMSSNDYSGNIDIAIQILGSKTKSLLDLEDEILVRGPYWNGLLGLNNLKTTQNSSVLIIARGVALAPAVMVSKYLLKNSNKVTFILDKGKINDYFIYDYIDNLNMVTIETDIFSDKGKILLQELINNNNYKLCYSGGSHSQHEEIDKLLKELSPNTKLAVSNNKEICCGEGICGSCSIKIGNKLLKKCKTQIETDYLLREEEL